MLHIISSNNAELLQQAAATITAKDAVVVLADVVVVDQHAGIINHIASCTSALYFLLETSAQQASGNTPNQTNHRIINDAELLSLCEHHSPSQTWY